MLAETTCTPFQSEPDAAPVRLIVRRVRPTPGSRGPLRHLLGFRPTRDGEISRGNAATPRSRMPSEPQVRAGLSPRAASPQRKPGWRYRVDGPQHRPLDSAEVWARSSPPRPSDTGLRSGGRITRSARRLTHASSAGAGPGSALVTAASEFHFQPDQPVGPEPPERSNRTSPPTRRGSLCDPLPTIRPAQRQTGSTRSPCGDCRQTLAPLQIMGFRGPSASAANVRWGLRGGASCVSQPSLLR